MFKMIAILAVTTLIPVAALSMNWEGHDDWLEHQNHGQKLRSVLPKPLATDLLSCDERRALAEGNPYEQRPVPGRNCHETLSDEPVTQ